MLRILSLGKRKVPPITLWQVAQQRSTAEFSYLFDAQAQQYAAFRPSYPDELYGQIKAYSDTQSLHELAVDVATGNGQAAVALAKAFDKACFLDICFLTTGQWLHAITYSLSATLPK